MSNLLKKDTIINNDERVIDYNELIRKKMQSIMKSRNNEMDADGFISGLHPGPIPSTTSNGISNTLESLNPTTSAYNS